MVALVTAEEGRKLSEKTPRQGTERESPPDFTRDLGERGNLVEQAQAERSKPLTRTQSAAQGQKQVVGPSNPPPDQKDEGAKAAPSAHKAQPEDPRLVAIQKEQERLKDEIEKARRLAQGTSKNIESQKRELEKMGGLDWAFGTSGALKDQIAADEKLLKEQQAQITKLEESARNQERLAQEVQKHTEDAKRLAAEGRHSDAQASAQLANSAAENARDASGEKMLIVTDEWRASQQQALAKYDDAISRINTTETVVQYVDTGVKTVGVVAGTVIAGPAGGAAVSMAYDSAKNLGEQGYSVASGDKTLGEAAKDFAVKEVDAAVDAGITLATGSVGRFAGGAVGGSLKGASRIAVKMGTAAASGAAVNTAAEGTKIGYEYGKACLEFNRQNPNLQGEARTKAWAAYCEERGLTEKDVARRLGGSALSGGITGLAGGLSPGAGRLLRGGVQTGTDVLGAAAQEAVSSGNVTPGGLVTAGVLGVLAHKAGSVRRTAGVGHSTGHPSTAPHHAPPDHVSLPKKAEGASAPSENRASRPPLEPHPAAHPTEQALGTPQKTNEAESHEAVPKPHSGPDGGSSPAPVSVPEPEKAPAKPSLLMQVNSDGTMSPRVTPQEVLSAVPPPIPVPDTAKMKGPKPSATCHIVEYEWKAKISEQDTPNLYKARADLGKSAPEAKVTLYYHEYKAGDYEPNYRINVRIGDTEFKGIPPSGWTPESGKPLKLSDLALVRNEDWTNAINAKKSGTATPEQLAMIKYGHLEPGSYPTGASTIDAPQVASHPEMSSSAAK